MPSVRCSPATGSIRSGSSPCMKASISIGYSRSPPAAIHAELWLPKDAPIVGAVAALTQEKGHRYLIDAAALVVREVPDARFVIFGEGELRPTLERQVKDLHLEKHVLLPGFRADILSFVRSFDLFVMSSLFEGLGTSLLDAMALSKATVASDTGWHSRSGRPRRDGPSGRAAREPRSGRCDFETPERPGAARTDGACRARARAAAVQRRRDDREDARGVPASRRRAPRLRGWHNPRSGHCASPFARLKPHQSAIPR